MQNKNFLIFEDIVEAIKKGEYDEFVQMSNDPNIRAIIFHMSQNQASIKETAEFYGMDEDDVKERIKQFVLHCDKLNDGFANRESFSRRGR